MVTFLESGNFLTLPNINPVEKAFSPQWCPIRMFEISPRDPCRPALICCTMRTSIESSICGSGSPRAEWVPVRLHLRPRMLAIESKYYTLRAQAIKLSNGQLIAHDGLVTLAPQIPDISSLTASQSHPLSPFLSSALLATGPNRWFG